MWFFGKKKKEKKVEEKKQETKKNTAEEETTDEVKKESAKRTNQEVATKKTAKSEETKSQQKKDEPKSQPQEEEITVQAEENGKQKKSVYRVLYDKEDKLWKIKKDGAKRVIDSKKTKEEALARVQELSKSQDTKFVVYKKDGKFQKKANLKLKNTDEN